MAFAFMVFPFMDIKEYLKAKYLPSRLDMRPGSARQLRTAAGQFCDWRPVPLGELCDEIVAEWLRYLVQIGRSPATVNSKRRAVLTVWRHAFRKGHVDQPPRDVPKCHEPQRIPRAWTVAEVEALVAACRKEPGEIAGIAARYYWPSLVLAVYNTGARISALRSVRCADCNLAERCLIVRHASQKQRRDRLFWLTDQTVAAIASHYNEARELVWPWPLHPDRLWKRFGQIVERSGIPDNRRHCDLFYKLRRTNLSYTAAAGGVEMAARQAGHASSRTTRTHYLDPRIAREQTAADVLPTLEIK